MTLSSFTSLDYLIALIVLVSAGFAAWRGFLSETLGIFAWVAAAFASLYFGPTVIAHLHNQIAARWLAALIAYAGVFLLVFVPLAFLSRRLSESVRKSAIGSLDRVAGLGFGVVRGLVILGLAYLAFTYLVPIRRQPHWLTGARLLPVVQSSASALLSLVPHTRKDDVQDQDVHAAPATDPMAALIRKNAAVNSVSRTAPEPAGAKVTKFYGAKDRQALDSLVETGGSAKP